MFFKKKVNSVTTEEIHNNMISLLDEIDNEVAQIEKELNDNTDTQLVKTSETLKKIGFVNTPIARKRDEELDTIMKKEKFLKNIKEEKNFSNNYMIKYPTYKFIPKRIFTKVLKKYGLVNAKAEYYTKDIPYKNILEIEKFYELYHSEVYYLIRRTMRGEDILDVSSTREQAYELRNNVYRSSNVRIELGSSTNIHIAAPFDHFIHKRDEWSQIYNMDIDKDGNLNFYRKVEDPIVTSKVEGGYIIITAWGPEAEDELVVNQNNN